MKDLFIRVLEKTIALLIVIGILGMSFVLYLFITKQPAFVGLILLFTIFLSEMTAMLVILRILLGRF